MSTNIDLRNFLNSHNIRLWQLADLLNVSEATITRKLRHELSKEEKEKIFNLINNHEKEVN